MRKYLEKIVIGLCLCLCFGVFLDVSISNADENLSADEYLLQTGMPQKEVLQLDDEFKQFIVNDMKNAENQEFTYIKLDDEDMIMPRTNQVLENIEFDVYAYQSGTRIYIYPTYEFTAEVKPRGKDNFSFQVTDAMRVYEAGGQLWYMDFTSSKWELGGTLKPTIADSNGYQFSGNQLGTPDYSMKFKGCAYCHANVGDGDDKRIIMSYVYNPNRSALSVSFSVYGLGISYTSDKDVYSSAEVKVLTY